MKKLLPLACGFVLFASWASADIPQTIAYQGRVTDDSGIPAPDTSYTMRFGIYDSPTGGTLLWDSGNLSVELCGGVFNATLGDTGQPSLDLDFEQDYWFLVTFEGEDITPRQKLASVGYAYMSSGVVAGTQVEGSVDGGSALRVANTALSDSSHGLAGESASPSGAGVTGRALSTAGPAHGVHGMSASSGGAGVYGEAATDTSGYGVFSKGDAKVAGELEVDGFKLPTGASPGFVLTSDLTGIGTWQPGGSGSGDADWQVVGGDMYAIPPGNVGVGAASPQGKLHITANSWGRSHLYLENPSFGHTRVLQTSAGLIFRNYGATGSDYAFGFRDSTNQSLMVMMADGNVGIGVATPLEKLVVAGTAQLDGFRMPTGAVNGYVLRTDPNGTGTWQPDTVANPDGDWEVQGGNMHAIPTGNVGIGTTSPAGKLHVTAGSWAQPNLLLDNPAYGQTRILQAYGGLLFRNYDATGTGLAFGFRDSANTALMVIRADGNIGVGVADPPEKLVVGGTAQIEGFRMPTGAADGYVLKTDATGFGTWQPDSVDGDSDWEVTGGNMYAIPPGNVGIGTTTPVGKLHVTASSWTQPHLFLQNPSWGHTRVLQASSGLLFRNYAATGTNLAYGFRDSSDTGLMVIRSDGNVGIGVVNPSERLVVQGTAQVDGFKMPTAAVDGYVLKADPSGAGTWQPDSVGGGDEDWELAGDDMYSMPTGNVGVGTATPDAKLHAVTAGAGAAVKGVSTAALGTSYGVYGQSAATTGWGVYGHASSSSGATMGVYGLSGSTGGSGVRGRATAVSGATIGVAGRSDSPEGTGVHGHASATTGSTYGVYGRADSPTGYGVYSEGAAKVAGELDVTGFRMSTGAIDGYVLKSDTAGVGTWQPDSVDGDDDWEVVGSDMYAIPSGNVGIGASTPVGRLHVTATDWAQPHVYLENPSWGHSGILHGSGGLLFRNYHATGTDPAYGFRDSTDTELMVIRADGNVGIGVVNPLERLEVAGTARLDGFSMSTGAVEGYVLKTDATGAATWQPDSVGGGDEDWEVAGDDMYSIPTGNVGVGTVSPDAKLHAVSAGSGAAVKGVSTAALGTSHGVYGETAASTGLGVYGYASSSSGATMGVYGLSASTGGSGVTGRTTATSGVTVGVEGRADSPEGRGVQGYATATSGNSYGVYGQTDSPTGYGIYSQGNAKVAGVLEVSGFSMPPGAVDGYVLKSDAAGVGTWQPDSADGDADWEVSGDDMYSIPSGNVGVGVVSPSEKLDVAGTAQVQGFKMPPGAVDGYVLESDASGVGTWQATSPDDDWQVSGDDMYSIPTGSVGIGVNTPAQKLHVAGSIRLDSGGSVEFAGASTRIRESLGAMRATADGSMYLEPDDDVYVGTDGASPWVMFDNGLERLGVGTTSPNGRLHAETGSDAIALGGVNTTPTGTTYGVYGQVLSSDGYGVYSEGNAKVDGGLEVTQSVQLGDTLSVSGGIGAQHETRAVYGESSASFGIAYGGRFQAASSSGRGVYGLAASTLGAPIGVYGACNSTLGYGVYFTGGLAGTGTKSCVVKTSSGPTLLYCQESPECWFEDFGEGRLVNGRAHVELDRLFLETVTIDAANPMKVFVQLHDETCRGVAVKKGTTGFEVIELQGGTSGGTFDYRVVAKRKGYENDRLELCAAAEADPLLSP
jgi:hypothetical protein